MSWKKSITIILGSMRKIKEGSIAPAMHEMKVGEKLAYPMQRYASVQNTLTRVRHIYPEREYVTTTKSGELEVIRQK